MNLLAAYLDRTGHFARLRRVFEASAREVMPGVRIEVAELTASGSPPRLRARARGNRRDDINRAFLTTAAMAWRSPDPVAVCDMDLMFLRPIEDVWERPFDVAVTRREWKSPWNTGLWFMRPTEAARTFVAEWAALARYFALHEPAEVERHSGIDQAALARALDRNTQACVLELPCRHWNSTQSEWAQIDDETRVVHVKSALRRACFGSEPPPPGLQWAVDLWHRHERAAA